LPMLSISQDSYLLMGWWVLVLDTVYAHLNNPVFFPLPLTQAHRMVPD
jgi:hypothetical protein